VWLFAVVAVVIVALDVLTKCLVVAKLEGAQLHGEAPKRLVGGAIYLHATRNSGAAFSLGTSFTVILTAAAVAVVVVIIRTAGRLRSIGWAISLGLVLGGAIGNLIDRFFRSPGVGRGHVVDFISAFAPNGDKWPIFNIADSAITVGAILAAVLALAGVQFDGTRAGDIVRTSTDAHDGD
jgi:signal peptidase II